MAASEAAADAGQSTSSAVAGVPSFSWLGPGRKRNSVVDYRGFRADTHFVAIGDVVMLDPGDPESAPFVGWVRRLFEGADNQMMMRAQWFFRKEDCEDWLKEGGPVPPEARVKALATLAAAGPNDLFASTQVRSIRTMFHPSSGIFCYGQ
jgi:hypothetical protein